ncbi:hypothetical protein TrCOL_g1744 [Triparma columacea]|uniref:HNH nuclease domain-containing protein n=1 Tax=Triparma columacea TaxID=722753 RepID=A0A9W7GEL4_9STRA|nr:hypothetical protein TrCOL_g1744 [Triparma columacea]
MAKTRSSKPSKSNKKALSVKKKKKRTGGLMYILNKPAVSNFGRYRDTYGRIDYPSTNRQGYARFGLYGQKHNMHCVLGVAFNLRRKPGENSVDHKDRVRNHNKIRNLRYATTVVQNSNKGRTVSIKTGRSLKEAYILKDEVWMEVDFAPGYQVSNFGRYRTSQSPHRSYTPQPKAKDDYVRVTVGGVGGVQHGLHRLIGKMYCPKPIGWSWEDSWGWVIHHIDNNTANNKASNLQWVTRKENTLLGNLIASRRTDSKSILATKQSKVVLGRKMGLGNPWVRFLSIHDAARKCKVHTNGIDKCLSGRIQQTGGYKFKFAPDPKLRLRKGEVFRLLTPEIVHKARMIYSGEWDKQVTAKKKKKGKRKR